VVPCVIECASVVSDSDTKDTIQNGELPVPVYVTGMLYRAWSS
jgi:hypothetical protein